MSKNNDYTISFLHEKVNLRLKAGNYYIMALLVLKTKVVASVESYSEPDNEYEVITFMDNVEVTKESYLSDVFIKRMETEGVYDKGNYYCIQHLISSCEDIISSMDSVVLINDIDVLKSLEVPEFPN